MKSVPELAGDTRSSERDWNVHVAAGAREEYPLHFVFFEQIGMEWLSQRFEKLWVRIRGTVPYTFWPEKDFIGLQEPLVCYFVF